MSFWKKIEDERRRKEVEKLKHYRLTKTVKDEVSETENLKKREREMAQELKGMIDAAIKYIRRDFNTLIKDEVEAIKQYQWMAYTYGRFGWREIFSDILKDEREHLEKLRICLQSINEVYEKEGHIKS